MERNNYFHEVRYRDEEGQLRTIKVPVVQELARQGLDHLPERFIKQHRPNDSSILESQNYLETPPIIDMGRLRDPSIRARELSKLASDARDWGVFVLANHGISSSVLHGVGDVVKQFFGLSFEEKKGCVGTYANTDNMGYGRNFVKSEDQRLDWIDRLSMKAAPKGEDQGLQVWPQRPHNFRHAMEEYVSEARNVLDELLHDLAEAMSLDRNAFAKNFDPENSEIKVRVNYYPPCPRPDLAIGLHQHSDPSGLTLLIQFQASGGLQALRNSKWVTLDWPTDTLLVNVGDLLEIMSSGRYKSLWHRTVAQKDVERLSVALFYTPPSLAEIEPIKGVGFVDQGYKTVVVGQYIENYHRVSPVNDKKQTFGFAKGV